MRAGACRTWHPCCPEGARTTGLDPQPCSCPAGCWPRSCSTCCCLGPCSCWCCCQQPPSSTWDSCATPGSTRRPAPRAARCSRTAPLRRSSCWAFSRCLCCWCSPRPPAPAWPGASARCCRPPFGPVDPAAIQAPAKRSGRNATPKGRSSSAPGCDPRGPAKDPRSPNPGRPPNLQILCDPPISWPQAGELAVCAQIRLGNRVHASGSCAVLRAAARWHWTPRDWGQPSPAHRRWHPLWHPCCRGCEALKEAGWLSERGTWPGSEKGGLSGFCHCGCPGRPPWPQVWSARGLPRVSEEVRPPRSTRVRVSRSSAMARPARLSLRQGERSASAQG